MKESFRRSMAWLHTWVGLLLGWVLYFMFITGTAGYLDTEIDRWMRPELPVSGVAVPPHQVMHALAYLEVHAPEADRWFISLALDRNDPYPRVSWSGAQGEDIRARGNQQIDPATGSALAGRETGGGQALYRMHWVLPYLPKLVSDWLVGIATMFMLVALCTGVVVHRRMFSDFFTFRPGKGQRSWLDAHNVVAVVTLPFQLMVAWSGLIFLMSIYMPLVIAAWYGPGGDNRKVFFDEMFQSPGLTEASGQMAGLANLDTVLTASHHLLGGAPVSSIDIRHPQDAHARIIVRGDLAAGPLRAVDVLVFDGVSGEVLAQQPALHSSAKAFHDVMQGLHEGLFADPALRALYVFSGLLGAVMIATGMIHWTVKRRRRVEMARTAPNLGLRLVEKLNVATIIGLPIAIAAYFWANRLLPLGITSRSEREIHSLFLIWLAMYVHAAMRPAGRIWQEQAWLASVAFGLLPLLNAITTDRHLVTSIPAGDWVFAGFDLSMMGLGLAFAAIARQLQRPSRACASTTQMNRAKPASTFSDQRRRKAVD